MSPNPVLFQNCEEFCHPDPIQIQQNLSKSGSSPIQVQSNAHLWHRVAKKFKHSFLKHFFINIQFLNLESETMTFYVVHTIVNLSIFT